MVEKLIEKIMDKASALPYVDTPLSKAIETYNNAFDKDSTFTAEEKIQACNDVIIAQHKELAKLRREAIHEVVIVKNDNGDVLNAIGCASAYHLSKEIEGTVGEVFCTVDDMIKQDNLVRLPFVELEVEEVVGG